MGVKLRGPRNLNDTATTPADVVVGITAVTLLPINLDRIFCNISNTSHLHIRIKLQAASVDNLIEGILVQAGDSWEMPSGNTYTGEISAILDTGAGTVQVGVTEY